MTFAPYSEDYYILRTGIGQSASGLIVRKITPSSYSEKLFEKQDRVKTNKDFWKFAEDDLMNGLYWEELYNKGRRVTEFKCPHSELLATQPCPVPPTDRNVMYENRMLGVPRLRQIKTTNTSCLDTLLTDFSTAIRSVHPAQETFKEWYSCFSLIIFFWFCF